MTSSDYERVRCDDCGGLVRTRSEVTLPEHGCAARQAQNRQATSWSTVRPGDVVRVSPDARDETVARVEPALGNPGHVSVWFAHSPDLEVRGSAEAILIDPAENTHLTAKSEQVRAYADTMVRVGAEVVGNDLGVDLEEEDYALAANLLNALRASGWEVVRTAS